jgi:hypothetical protein
VALALPVAHRRHEVADVVAGRELPGLVLTGGEAVEVDGLRELRAEPGHGAVPAAAKRERLRHVHVRRERLGAAAEAEIEHARARVGRLRRDPTLRRDVPDTGTGPQPPGGGRAEVTARQRHLQDTAEPVRGAGSGPDGCVCGRLPVEVRRRPGEGQHVVGARRRDSRAQAPVAGAGRRVAVAVDADRHDRLVVVGHRVELDEEGHRALGGGDADAGDVGGAGSGAGRVGDLAEVLDALVARQRPAVESTDDVDVADQLCAGGRLQRLVAGEAGRALDPVGGRLQLVVVLDLAR